METNLRAVKKDHYPEKDYLVCVVTSKKEIKKELESKSVCNWGQKPIGDTGYFLLAQTSPQSAGDKISVFVCKHFIVRELKREQHYKLATKEINERIEQLKARWEQ